MLIPGYDSAYPPNGGQASQAYLLGVRWWGFYLQGLSNTDPLREWAPGEEAILNQFRIAPVPIAIPAPPHPADAVQLATQAYNTCKLYGLSPEVAICYNGSHISVNGPVWLPIPGAPPHLIGPQSAIQYGTGSLLGLSVDFNLSTEDFPMSKGIVCDLEFNVNYTPQWYQTFQQTIAQLSMEQHMARQAIPEPVIESSATGTQDANGDLIRWDVILIGKNTGKAYHIWWHNTSGWTGPENLCDPG